MDTRFVNCKSVLHELFNHNRKMLTTSVYTTKLQMMPSSASGQAQSWTSSDKPVCARNALDNKILSEMDGLIFQLLSARYINRGCLMTLVDLLCYSACKTSISSLLKESGIITWGLKVADN